MRTALILLTVAFVVAGCADDGTDASSRTIVDRVAASATTSTTVPAIPDADAAAVAAPTDVTDDVTVDMVVDVATDLSPDEIAGLLWMREEEQLAHDVYTELGARWDLPIFSNIASSEQHHIESTIALLDRYGIDDPAAGNDPGTFTDPDIQQLYDGLVAQGSASLTDALVVGATIEELDIADLRARAAATDETDIVDVYQRLERGSRNHLRGFVRQLERRGEVYEPTLLDDVDAIVDSPIERGAGA